MVVVDYDGLLRQAVAVLENARCTISRSIANGVSNAHWEIGKLLHERKLDSKHGAGVVKRLSSDLKERYPKMGVSPRQLWNMKRFYERFSSAEPKLLQAVAVLPWGHTLELMTNKSTKDNDDAILYYATEIITKGWNRDLLTNAICLDMYGQHCLSSTNDNNLANTLPSEQASYANEVLKSTYKLGFLGVTEPMLEIEEQTKIAERLSAIEKKIAVEMEIKDCYVRQRKYLLQQMFI